MNLKNGTLEMGEKKQEIKLKDSQTTLEISKKSNRKLVIGIITLILGLATLIGGVAFLIITLTKGPKVQDAEYLVEVGSWQREDEPSVVWNFTEIGKGSLTTNEHKNDYDFIWAMDGNKLKIETEWLYTIDDDFEYKLKDGKLVLDDKIVFVPVS